MAKLDDKLPNLSVAAKEVLAQLFNKGPEEDGDLCSKSGRTELLQQGYAEYWNGWNFLTAKGVQLCAFYRLDREKERNRKEQSKAMHYYRTGEYT